MSYFFRSGNVSAATAPWSQRREAEAIVKNVTVHPIKPAYVTLVFAWKSIAGILLLPQLQLLVCSIIFGNCVPKMLLSISGPQRILHNYNDKSYEIKLRSKFYLIFNLFDDPESIHCNFLLAIGSAIFLFPLFFSSYFLIICQNIFYRGFT